MLLLCHFNNLPLEFILQSWRLIISLVILAWRMRPFATTLTTLDRTWRTLLRLLSSRQATWTSTTSTLSLISLSFALLLSELTWDEVVWVRSLSLIVCIVVDAWIAWEVRRRYSALHCVKQSSGWSTYWSGCFYAFESNLLRLLLY